MKKSDENLTHYLREATIGSILLPRDRLKTPWPFIALYATEVFLFSLRFKCFPDTLDVSTAKNDRGASREPEKHPPHPPASSSNQALRAAAKGLPLTTKVN